jgi:hypothetical protein
MDTCGKLRHDLFICQALETLVGVELAHRPGWARNAETVRLERLRAQLHSTVEELVEEIETEDSGAEEAPAL